MAMSGVKLTEECQKTYQSIQKDKSHRYAIFKIADGQICLDKVSSNLTAERIERAAFWHLIRFID